MNTTQNRAVITAYFDAFNRGDIDGVCRLFSPDAENFGVLARGGLHKARPIWEELLGCFRMNSRVEAMVAEGDSVAVRSIERGTFSSPFRGIPPTGKPYEIIAMDWFALRGGKIIQRWGAHDSAAVFRQMGVPLTSFNPMWNPAG
jgi:predicted ester cyclase